MCSSAIVNERSRASSSPAQRQRCRGLRALVALWVLAIAAPALADEKTSMTMRSGAGGAVYSVPVMTWHDIPFRTVVRQQYDYSCGSAAVATLLRYHYGEATRESDAFSWMWKVGDPDTIRKSGFSMLDMRAYLKAIGYRADGFRVSLDDVERLKTPAIVLIKIGPYKHFVVIKGIRDGQVLVGDPALGLLIIERSKFKTLWNGIVFVIRDTPGHVAKPSFNDETEWSPWANASLDSAYASSLTHAADMTLSLPPYYQFTPIRNVPPLP